MKQIVVPSISIVVPVKDEEITIETFIDWCLEGLAHFGGKGQILLLDGSTQTMTRKLAERAGVQVLKIEKPGLGAAYKAAVPHITGEFVVLGDADLTYDFRDFRNLIEPLLQEADLVIGNRFKGNIQKGSMPILHRYFGTPISSWIFKFFLGLPVGDVHCGLRALTQSLYRKLPWHEEGWEYAPEMISSARNLGARISEVPINFYKAPEGRLSHQKRNGWKTPFKAGWGALRVTLTYSLDRVLSSLAFVPLVISILGIFFSYVSRVLNASAISGPLGSLFLWNSLTISVVLYAISLIAAATYSRPTKSLLKLSTRKSVNSIMLLLGMSILFDAVLLIIRIIDILSRGTMSFRNVTLQSEILVSALSITICLISILASIFISKLIFSSKNQSLNQESTNTNEK